METGLHQGPPRLCDFISQHRDRILQEWTRHVRRLPVADDLSQPRLIDHLPELLDRIAEIVRTVHEGGNAALDSLPKLHAIDRLDRGFDLNEVVSEYALLRDCVVELFGRAFGEVIRAEEVRRFNQTIDQAIRECAQHYTQQRLRILAALDRLTMSSPGAAPLEELLDRLLRVFVESSEAVDASSILLLEDDGTLLVRASIGLSDEVKNRWRVPFGQGFAGTIAATGQPRMLRNASEDVLPRSPYIRAAGIRALYGVPLTFNDEVLGVAHMGSRTAFEFSDEDRALFRVLTTRAAVFIYESIMRNNAERRAAELQATIEAIPGEVLIGDVEKGVTRANGAALAMLGLKSADELPMAPERIAELLDFRDADTGKRVSPDGVPLVGAMRGERQRRDLRVHHIGRDQDIFIRTVAAPIKRQDEVVGTVCVCLDVSDRHALEREREELLRKLEEERERLHETLRQVPAGVVIADARTERIVLSNEAAAAIWRSPMAGETARAYRPGRTYWADGRAMSPDELPLTRALRGEAVSQEVRIHRLDGTWATCLSSAAPIRTQRGEIIAAVVTFVDITERKTAEEQLRALANNIPQLAWIADSDANVLWYNRQWFDYTGTTFEEMQGRGWQKVHHPDHLARVVEKVREHFSAGTVWEDTFPLRGKDGRYRWFLSRAIPIRDESGRVARWFGTNTDITEQRRLSEAREQFIGILGHDLRNPLNAISMSAAVLQKRFLNDTLGTTIARITSSAQRMQTMISDLLDFTRGRLGGGIPIEPKAIDCRTVAAAVVDEIRATNPDTSITLDVQGDTRGRWDEMRLGQILQNLVMNAIQHGDPSRGVAVNVDGRDSADVTMTVTNHGPVIPPEMIPHLFEPFRRLAQSTAGSSLGLGLYIVSEIAHAHHGRIAVRSSDEEGTAFEVRLPRDGTVSPVASVDS